MTLTWRTKRWEIFDCRAPVCWTDLSELLGLPTGRH